MQLNILWTGREYYSLENCLVDPEQQVIVSTILGMYEKKLYEVNYLVRTNSDWETVFAKISYRHADHQEQIILESDGKGNWEMNGAIADRFKGCTDIDIPLTPFTNTLPIRRLKLRPSQSKEIRVVYCDLLERQIHPVNQKYTCISETSYHYENIPNDFEATITTDTFGLVVDYPSLFVRTTAVESKYMIEQK